MTEEIANVSQTSFGAGASLELSYDPKFVLEFYRGFVRDKNVHPPAEIFWSEAKFRAEELTGKQNKERVMSIHKCKTFAQCKNYLRELFDIETKVRWDAFKPLSRDPSQEDPELEKKPEMRFGGTKENTSDLRKLVAKKAMQQQREDDFRDENNNDAIDFGALHLPSILHNVLESKVAEVVKEKQKFTYRDEHGYFLNDKLLGYENMKCNQKIDPYKLKNVNNHRRLEAARQAVLNRARDQSAKTAPLNRNPIEEGGENFPPLIDEEPGHYYMKYTYNSTHEFRLPSESFRLGRKELESLDAIDSLAAAFRFVEKYGTDIPVCSFYIGDLQLKVVKLTPRSTNPNTELLNDLGTFLNLTKWFNLVLF
jgi:hypothetical protein